MGPSPTMSNPSIIALDGAPKQKFPLQCGRQLVRLLIRLMQYTYYAEPISLGLMRVNERSGKRV